MKEVTKEEFYKFIKTYPKKLERDVYGAFDPPLVTYNDFSIDEYWPEATVASFRLGIEGQEDHYFRIHNE